MTNRSISTFPTCSARIVKHLLFNSLSVIVRTISITSKEFNRAIVATIIEINSHTAAASLHTLFANLGEFFNTLVDTISIPLPRIEAKACSMAE